MTLKNYLVSRLPLFLVNLSGNGLLALYLHAVGNNVTIILVVVCTWLTILGAYLIVEYQRRKHYFAHLFGQLRELDKGYLIHEVMAEPQNNEDRLYQQLIKELNQAALAEINNLERDQKEYREFVESWVHETKQPMTSLRLATSKLQAAERVQIEKSLTELDNNIEQALFYARSDKVYQDYQIDELSLAPLITAVLSKNKYLMIHSQMQAQVQLTDEKVFCDGKWLAFIISQILINAINYQKNDQGIVTFSSKKSAEGLTLIIEDQGVGISAADIQRVFQKGFTGQNGRRRKQTTGIGLYLCKKLCDKLGLKLSIESQEGQYTRLLIYFPKHSFLSTLQDY